MYGWSRSKPSSPETRSSPQGPQADEPSNSLAASLLPSLLPSALSDVATSVGSTLESARRGLTGEPSPQEQVAAAHARTIAASHAAVVASLGRTTVVQRGDTLGTIAERLGHPGEYQALFDANRDRLRDINTVEVGVRLRLPEAWNPTSVESGASDPQLESARAAATAEGAEGASWSVGAAWDQGEELVRGVAESLGDELDGWRDWAWGVEPADQARAPEITGEPPEQAPSSGSSPVYLSQMENETNATTKGGATVRNDSMCSVTTMAIQICTMAGSEAEGRRAVVQLLEADFGQRLAEPDRSSKPVADLLYRRFALWTADNWLAACRAGERVFGWTGFMDWAVSPGGIAQAQDGRFHQMQMCQAFVLDELCDHVGAMGTVSMDQVQQAADRKENRSRENYENNLAPIVQAGGTVLLATKLTGGHIVMLDRVEPDGIVLQDPYGMGLARSRYLVNGETAGDLRKRISKLDPQGSLLKLRTRYAPELADALRTAPDDAVLHELGKGTFYTWDEVESLEIGGWNIRVEAAPVSGAT